jgi:hypothetical protein
MTEVDANLAGSGRLPSRRGAPSQFGRVILSNYDNDVARSTATRGAAMTALRRSGNTPDVTCLRLTGAPSHVGRTSNGLQLS